MVYKVYYDSVLVSQNVVKIVSQNAHSIDVEPVI